MSAVVDFVEDVFGEFVGAVAELAQTLWEDVLNPSLEFTFGLIGIKAEDVISTSMFVQRLIPEDNTATDLLTKVLLQEQKNPVGIIDRIMAYAQVTSSKYTGISNYAESTFVDGLPDCNLRAIVIDNVAIKAVLDRILRVNTTIVSSKLTTLQKNEWVGFWLQQNYYYRPWKNELLYSDNKTYKVNSIDYDYELDNYRVYIEDVTTPTNTKILIAPVYDADRYYIVKYSFVNTNQWYYWVYKNGSGTYPTLDAVNVYQANLEMLPVVTIRNSTVNVSDDPESERYAQSKKMLGMLGIDIDQITDSLNESPDIANIEDAFIHFGIQPKNTLPVTSKVLYSMFDYSFDNVSIKEKESYLVTGTEGVFNFSIAWSEQTRVSTTGIIGPIGTYTHEIVGKNLIMKKQVAEETYVVLSVNNLSSIAVIDRQGLSGVVGNDVDSDNFFILPSSHFITTLSPLEQYSLYNSSLLLTVYAAQVTHLEWYETEAFMDLVKIVGIAITIFTLGTAGSLVQALILIAEGVLAGLLLKLVMEATDSVFLRALAAIAYAYFVGGAAMENLAADASALVEGVTMFASYAGSIGYAISLHANIEMDKLTNQKNIFGQQLDAAMDEIAEVTAQFTGGLLTPEVVDIQQTEVIPAYLYGVDAMMYKARDAQYDFSSLYDYDRFVTDYYNQRKLVGVV